MSGGRLGSLDFEGKGESCRIRVWVLRCIWLWSLMLVCANIVAMWKQADFYRLR